MFLRYSSSLTAGVGIALTLANPYALAGEFSWSGKIAAEARVFAEDGIYPGQEQNSNLSLAIEPDFYWQSDSGQNVVSFKPFYRVDQNDDERTHGDIRELGWEYYGDDWELRAGLRKVYWGVTEFQHLVDVINQNDGVEDIDGEDKLGQPMINLSLVRDWGIIDVFVLPGFRERTFPGEEGRLRASLPVDTDNAQYEDDDEEKHVDYAVRWSQTFGDFDVGVHGFTGTNRTPAFSVGQDGDDQVLLPFYEQMTQYGIDLQATIDSWLWKFEAISRDTKTENYAASQAGFEYSFYGVRGSNADLGVLLEYGWDERGEDANSIFQNDVSVGARLALNDVNSTELLAGVIYDLDFEGASFQVEASRRVGDFWKLSLDGRIFSSDDPRDLISAFEKDSHLQFTAEMYF